MVRRVTLLEALRESEQPVRLCGTVNLASTPPQRNDDFRACGLNGEGRVVEGCSYTSRMMLQGPAMPVR